jgi:ribosome-associated translation inhibitor RaiA
MQIQINSDHTITTSEPFSNFARQLIENTLHNHKSQITRIEVHMSDENGEKSGADDKRCVLEARLAGRKPTAVTEYADTLEGAISGAADKLKHALIKILDKEHDHHPRFASPTDDAL